MASIDPAGESKGSGGGSAGDSKDSKASADGLFARVGLIGREKKAPKDTTPPLDITAIRAKFMKSPKMEAKQIGGAGAGAAGAGSGIASGGAGSASASAEAKGEVRIARERKPEASRWQGSADSDAKDAEKKGSS